MSYAPIPTEPASTTREYLHSTEFPITSKNSVRRKRTPRNERRANQNFRSDYPIIVHCHLCWDWVWQRPQQFVSRLSQRHQILFVEMVAPAPELATPMARFRKAENLANVTILTLQFPTWRWGEGNYVDTERRRIVQDFISGPGAGRFDNPVQWFYDPMVVPAFLGQMNELLTVYDCMDELSKFKCAPPEIIGRETKLLKRADVVFTGGRKLFELKSQLNDNCHFYGCGVDCEHFGKAQKKETEVPEDLVAIYSGMESKTRMSIVTPAAPPRREVKRHVLGYFGVVDERMDYDLITRLADASPDWSVVMVGPVIKVDAARLPKRPNLHWLGQRSYSELPAYCKGFDVCLMPFALNESTEFINPTKALEYMAAGRMIVSTAVPDVVRNFGSVAKVARNQDEFITMCRRAIEEPEPEKIELGLQMASENTWERIVARMEGHVEEAIKAKCEHSSANDGSIASTVPSSEVETENNSPRRIGAMA